MESCNQISNSLIQQTDKHTDKHITMGSPSPTFMHYDVSGAVKSDIQGMNRQLEKDGLMKEFLRCAHTIQFTRRMMGVDHLTGEKICDDDLYCNVVLFRE